MRLGEGRQWGGPRQPSVCHRRIRVVGAPISAVPTPRSPRPPLETIDRAYDGPRALKGDGGGVYGSAHASWRGLCDGAGGAAQAYAAHDKAVFHSCVHDSALRVVPRWKRALWLLHSDDVWAAYAQADQDDEVRRVWSN